jgi:hypothetical protein
VSAYKYLSALLPICRLHAREPGVSYLQELQSWQIGLFVACAITLTMVLQEAEAGQFEAPDLNGFILHVERDEDGDGDGDGVKETHVRQYLSQTGDSIFSMTTNGHLWAWSLDIRNEETGGARNYVIRDSNCDAIFDEVYGLDDGFHVPACLK